ncbi:hypothetical protein ACFPOA_12520 [Lysobacter niabensis]|uniref:hypothetical protein n=1 Tax=Agrilutibacter niabensis TaxID=380628 RepID=UPI003614D071
MDMPHAPWPQDPLPPMTAYRNRGGDSGVAAYALLADALIVRFDDGATYLYGPARPGRHHVGRMKSLAMSGRGLNAYIRRYVREKHQAQLAP